MKPKALAVLFGALVLLFSPAVVGDSNLPSGHVRITTGEGTLVAPDGQRYFLPVGTHILDGLTWDKLDKDTRDTKNQVTRLKAENESLKRSLSSWEPGWGTLIVITGLALAAGGTAYYLNH